jgi:DNA-binding response OmpR family regulator
MAENNIVLIVEDNVRILDLNRQILEKDGFMVLRAQTLKAARDLLEVTAPAVAVLDITLPDGSGLDLLPDLRQKGAAVLILTAKAKHKDLLAGLAAGGTTYMTKPYDIKEFRLRVRNLLDLVNDTRTQYLAKAVRAQPPVAGLSPKELGVALMAARGSCNKEIAAQLNLSESRIKALLGEIYNKLDIADCKDKRAKLAELLDGTALDTLPI